MNLIALQNRLTLLLPLLLAAGAVTMQPLVWVAFAAVIALQVVLLITSVLR